MADLTLEQIEEWRRWFSNGWGTQPDKPSFDALCDLALRGLEQNSAAHGNSQSKSEGTPRVDTSPAPAEPDK